VARIQRENTSGSSEVPLKARMRNNPARIKCQPPLVIRMSPHVVVTIMIRLLSVYSATQASSGVALSVNCSLLSKLFSRAYTESLMYISTESMLNKTIGVDTISN
jgi:hypothetical protein